MLVRRVFLALPVIALFALTAIIFLAARAPRTWSAHWSTPRTLASGAGEAEYGVTRRSDSRWDLLWVNDDLQSLIFTPGGTRARPLTVDRGDLSDPTLVRSGRYELGAWVRNRNGATDLMAAVLSPVSDRRVYRLATGPQPIEHPFLFPGPGGTVDLVASWQRYGNFDVFLFSLNPRTAKPTLIKRLTKSEYYGFYPRAVTDAAGVIHLLHLENCCRQRLWLMQYDRFSDQGRHLGKTVTLARFSPPDQSGQLPSQWGEDLQLDGRGRLWGAFTLGSGVWVFEADRQGRVLEQPTNLAPQAGRPEAVTIAPDESGGRVFWVQTFDLGTYLDSQRFDARLNPVGAPDRVVYEAASQTNPHAVVSRGRAEVMWQAITPGLSSTFQVAAYRRQVQPTLAQRLGLGLGDPWEAGAVLVVSSVGVATLTTVTNMLLVFLLGACGLVLLRLLRRWERRWLIYALLLTGALYFAFVAPGGPMLFLGTLPSMGLPLMPFGMIATASALAFVLWMGLVAMRRLEDLYRAGLMAAFGVYFFAFLEAVVFIQQRLGFI